MPTKPLSDAQLAGILVKQGHAVDFPVRKARKKPDNEESRIQQDVIKWWHDNHEYLGVKNEKLLCAIPNGGMRNPIIGAVMKREGLRSGFPDLVLFVMRRGFGALIIEMKKPDGIVRPDQREVMLSLNQEGYSVNTCFSFAEAIQTVVYYLA